ncbi:hypothetical protein BH09SUM1_BH09SUM1_10650 [soil metagenome]
MSLDPYAEFLRWLFTFHRLRITERRFTLGQEFDIEDDAGAIRFRATRPAKVFQSMLAAAAGASVYLLSVVFALQYLFSWQWVATFLILFTGAKISGLVRAAVRPFHEITISSDIGTPFPVLYIHQENRFGLHQQYRLYDGAGQTIAIMRRNMIIRLVSRHWEVQSPTRQILWTIRERSVTLSLVRRVTGTLFGLLAPHYDFWLPNGSSAGNYERRLSVRRCHELNLYIDRIPAIDTRAALAATILLHAADGA